MAMSNAWFGKLISRTPITYHCASRHLYLDDIPLITISEKSMMVCSVNPISRRSFVNVQWHVSRRRSDIKFYMQDDSSRDIRCYRICRIFGCVVLGGRAFLIAIECISSSSIQLNPSPVYMLSPTFVPE